MACLNINSCILPQINRVKFQLVMQGYILPPDHSHQAAVFCPRSLPVVRLAILDHDPEQVFIDRHRTGGGHQDVSRRHFFEVFIGR